jgi:hypothetical protein
MMKTRVLNSLAHFNREVRYFEGDPTAVVVVGDLCLCFEVLDVPHEVGFRRYPSWVRFSHAFLKEDW